MKSVDLKFNEMKPVEMKGKLDEIYGTQM